MSGVDQFTFGRVMETIHEARRDGNRVEVIRLTEDAKYNLCVDEVVYMKRDTSDNTDEQTAIAVPIEIGIENVIVTEAGGVYTI